MRLIWPVGHSVFTTDLDNIKVERRKVRFQFQKMEKCFIEEGAFGTSWEDFGELRL